MHFTHLSQINPVDGEIITVAPTVEAHWLQTWGIEIVSGYTCTGDFIELGTLNIENTLETINPFSFLVQTEGDLVTITWNGFTLGSLTPQVVSLVLLQF